MIMNLTCVINIYHGDNSKYFREAFDEGEYIRVGQLSSTSPKSDLKKNYTLRQAIKKAKSK